MVQLVSGAFFDALSGTNTLPDNANTVDGDISTRSHVSSANAGNSFAYTQDQSAVTLTTHPSDGLQKIGSQVITVWARHSDAAANLGSQASGNLFVKMTGTGNTAWIDLGALSLDTGGARTEQAFTFLAEDYPGFTGISEAGLSCSQGGGSPNSRGYIQIFEFEYTATYEADIPYNVKIWDPVALVWKNGRFLLWNPSRLEWEPAIVHKFNAGASTWDKLI